jgi:hypothetical protein
VLGTSSLQVNPIDTPQLRLGVDYRLGDLVGVIVDGIKVIDQVRAIETTISAGGIDRAITVGATAPLGVQALFAQLRRMAQRVSQLERI